MKIIADQQIPHLQAFSTFAEVTICNGREITTEKVRDADILLVRSVTSVNASLLDGSQVKFVATATSGQDHVDLEYLQRNNIGFAHAKGSNARSVAEYTLSSLFVLADQHGFNLKDKTVGVIGCGEVGSRVVAMLETIGVRCLMNDPPLKDAHGKDVSGTDPSAGEKYCDLKALFSADIITLHVPFTEDGLYLTKNLVDADFLAKLNDDVILINTARGGVIDETALKNHLACHEDMKVVLDAWEDEPEIDLELLTQVDISTPHIAGYSTDGKIHATQMIFESMCTFFNLDAKWQTTSVLPYANSLEIQESAELSDEDAIQMAVFASYDVRSDSISLRRLPEVDDEQRSHYFDELRKNYPVRREFPATLVHLHGSKKILAEKLKRLGFNVQASS
ncbi:MAG: erythronate-4-phosphate dehydrogenase [Gammaproteobacteria bacterium]|jgi:erythronate-4-phosphate dehydrogenase